MFRYVSKFLLLALGIAFSASAFEVKIVELVMETSTDNAPLPSAVPGTVVARMCPTCEARVLNVNAATQFFIPSAGQVTLEKLRQSCGSATVVVHIFYEAQSRVIRRIKAQCAP